MFMRVSWVVNAQCWIAGLAEVQAAGISGCVSRDAAGDVPMGKTTWLGPLDQQN